MMLTLSRRRRRLQAEEFLPATEAAYNKTAAQTGRRLLKA
ncbi:MAG: hypothetical protein JWR61_4804 [Ferruginibacter sp.]|nr:hypothetical protein [Ferruginibacter sp.]